MSEQDIPMAGEKKEDGSYLKGIEDYCPKEQYETEAYQDAVVEDIAENKRYFRRTTCGKSTPTIGCNNCSSAIW